MTRLSDYVAQNVSGLPEAPTDGQTYGRNGNLNSWEVVYTMAAADATFALKDHTHPQYVDLTTDQSIGGLKVFTERLGIGKVASASYLLDVGGSVNLSAGYNFYINGVPISSFVDAPSDGNIYGRQNAAWVEITSGGGGTVTNLGNVPSSTNVQITNSGGTDTTLPSATTSLAGVMTAADKTNLNNALKNGDVNLGVTRTSTAVTVTNTAGSNAVLPAATTSQAGVMTSTDKTNLNNALKNGDVDLAVTYSSTSVTITNSAGNNATILGADTGSQGCGMLTQVDKIILNACQADRLLAWTSTASTVILARNESSDLSLQSATNNDAGILTSQTYRDIYALFDAMQLIVPKMLSAGIITPADEAQLNALLTPTGRISP